MIDKKFFRSYYGPDHPKGPTVGLDVQTLKRGYARAGYFKWNKFDNVYNKKLQEAVRKFQQDNKIIPVTGYTGNATFDALKSAKKKGTKEPAIDAYGWYLFNKEKEAWESVNTEAGIRQAIVNVCMQLYSRRAYISYSQARPVAAIRYTQPPHLVKTLDCSGTAIYVYWAASAPSPDPTYGYTGYGNTWSLAKGGTRLYDEREVKKGDLAFYGSDLGHVAIVVATNPTRVVSMGSNSGPLYLDLRYRRDFRFFHRYQVL